MLEFFGLTFRSQLYKGLTVVYLFSAFCSAPVNGEKGHGCNVKGGNPFRSFWEGIGIDFDHSEIYKNMGSRNGDMDQWNMQ